MEINRCLLLAILIGSSLLASGQDSRMSDARKEALKGAVEVSISSDRHSYKQGEPILLTATIKNVGEAPFYVFPGTSFEDDGDGVFNLLYRLSSPDFLPKGYMPLHHVAIGSGERLAENIAGIREMIFASQVGNYHMEAFWFGTAMESFLKGVDEKTVGGLFPMMKLEYGRVMRLGQNSTGYFPGGYDIRLEPMPDGSWIQKNLVIGKEIPLVPPWEIETPTKDMKFDDIRYGIFG